MLLREKMIFPHKQFFLHSFPLPLEFASFPLSFPFSSFFPLPVFFYNSIFAWFGLQPLKERGWGWCAKQVCEDGVARCKEVCRLGSQRHLHLALEDGELGQHNQVVDELH